MDSGAKEIILTTQRVTGFHQKERARYSILTANGPQTLSVPVSGGKSGRSKFAEAAVDNTHNWRRQHWGALYSAYGRAPYFEHYKDSLKAVLGVDYRLLTELSRASIEWLSKEMCLGLRFITSTELEQPCSSAPTLKSSTVPLPAYHQVFENRWGFQPDLSAIDLLMNEGPYAADYLLPLQ